MRILNLDRNPIHQIRCLNAGRRPGMIEERQVPVLAGVVSGLPDTIEALVVTSDLQFRESFDDAHGRPPRLLGEVLPDRLADEWLAGWGFPSAARTGVLLAGDFWTEAALDARGGIGDVTGVWKAFGDRFAWVAGVAGNHDAFGPNLHAPPRFVGNLHFFDGHRRQVGGLKLAGLSGIIGDPCKPWRRHDADYLAKLERAATGSADVLILHDGPDAPSQRGSGSSAVREVIERCGPSLVVRGHRHWAEPLVELGGGVQVLNVDARVVLLKRSDDSQGTHPPQARHARAR